MIHSKEEALNDDQLFAEDAKAEYKRAFVASLRRCLPASGVRRRGAIVAFGTVLAQAIQTVGIPLIGRLYSPAIFGLWSVLQNLAGIPSSLGGMRYELAIVVGENDSEAANLAVLQALWCLGVSAATLAAVCVFHSRILLSLAVPQLAGWIYIAPLLVLLTGLANNLGFWMLRFEQFRTLATFRIAQSAGTIGSQGALAPITGSAPSGLVLGGVFGLVSPFLVALPEIKNKYARFGREVSWSGIRNVAAKYRGFPKYVVPYSLVAALRERGVVILLSGFFGTQVVGLYAIAVRVAYAPVQLIASSLSPVVFQHLTKDIENRSPFVLRAFRELAFLTMPGFIYLAWYSRVLFTTVMGRSWGDAGAYAEILAAPAAMQILTGPFDRLFDVIRKQHIALILESIYTLAALLTMGASHLAGASPTQVVLLFSVVTVAYQFLWLAAICVECSCASRDLGREAVYVLALIVPFIACFGAARHFLSGPLAFAASTGILCAYYGILIIWKLLPVRR